MHHRSACRQLGQARGQIQTQYPDHRAPAFQTFRAWGEPTGSTEPAAGGWCHGTRRQAQTLPRLTLSQTPQSPGVEQTARVPVLPLSLCEGAPRPVKTEATRPSVRSPTWDSAACPNTPASPSACPRLLICSMEGRPGLGGSEKERWEAGG